MQNLNNILMEMSLFNDIDKEKFIHVLHCLRSEEKIFDKDQIIYDMGDGIKKAGIVIEGKVNEMFITHSGDVHNVRQFEKGMLFGETRAFIKEPGSTIQLIASARSKILFVHFTELFTNNAKQCPYVSQVTMNLLKEISENDDSLIKKIEILSHKRIRDKMTLYLKTLEIENDIIKLSLNRQEMADYLGVDRSALSRELGYMRNEGLITFNKSYIKIIDKSLLE